MVVIVSGLYSQNKIFAFASICVARPVPTQHENKEVAQLSNAAVDAARLIPMGSIRKTAL